MKDTVTIEVCRARMSVVGDYRPPLSVVMHVGAVPPVGASARFGPDQESHTVRQVIYTLDDPEIDAIVIVELDTVWDGKQFVYPPDRSRQMVKS